MSQTTVALALVEGRRLLRHPLFLVGVGFVAFGVVAFVRAGVAATSITWEDDGWMIGAGAELLGILTMIAANLSGLRDRRSGMLEQAEALPVEPAPRTGGLLLSVLGPVAFSLLLLGVVTAYAATETNLSALDLIHLVAIVAAVGTLGALGIAIARWFPTPFVAPVAAWGIILTAPGDRQASWNALSPFATGATIGMALWHVAFLTGLTVCFASAALHKDGAGRRAIAAAAIGLVVVIASAWVMLPGACPEMGRCAF
jgi:hypothetical protein